MINHTQLGILITIDSKRIRGSMINNTDLPVLDRSRTDDPEVVATAKTDDYAGHIVPKSWRSSRLSLSMAWLSIISAMFWLVFPVTLALEVGVANTLIGMVLAAVVIAVAAAIVSPYATRSGMSLTMYSRQLMGRRVGLLIGLIVAVTCIYYTAFEASVIAVVFHAFFSGLSIEVWYVITAAMGVVLALGGVRAWLDRFNGALLPVYIIGMIVAVVWATTAFGYNPDWLTYTPAGAGDTAAGPGWVLAFGGYLSQLIFITYLWDFARMGRVEDSKFHAFGTFGLPTWLVTFVVNALIGLYLLSTIQLSGPPSNTAAVLGIVSLMGFLGVLLVWATQSRIQTTNFYVSSLNLQSFFRGTLGLRLPRSFWGFVVGAVCLALMLTDVISYVLTALNYQTVVVAGWIAIACVHIIDSRRAGLNDAFAESRPGRIPVFSPAAVLAWVISSATGILLLTFTGAFGATWAVPAVLVIALISYKLLLLVFPRRDVERPWDPREEVEDPWEDRVRCETCTRRYLAIEIDRNPANNLKPICASCAENNGAFLAAAGAESRRP
ncbi:purine-cytosine permease family protein [Paenarthrobacter sp. NCHU4564]|uniref:purine-cytosine permease family protein n=1 Tax=Paenarthrobacter sp. NCHU4564 TaxID=3451353 RepID=UPI003F989ADC